MDHLKYLVDQTYGMNIDEICNFYKTKYKCKVNVKLPLFTPMYTYKTNFDKFGSLATRGTVFSLNDQGIFDSEVVCVPFFKFFNKDKKHAPNTDELVVKSIQRKYDGSLIKVFKHHSKWIIASNGTSVADDKFQKLFERAIGKQVSEFNEIFDDSCIYVFELCTPKNKIKKEYTEFKATLLLTRCRITWDELPNETHSRYDIVEELEEFDFNEHNEEGVVIVYECGQRVKCKTLWYLFLYQFGDVQYITERQHIDKAIQTGFYEHVKDICSDQMLEYATRIFEAVEFTRNDIDVSLKELDDISGLFKHKKKTIARNKTIIEEIIPPVFHKSVFDILFGKTTELNLRDKYVYNTIKLVHIQRDN